MDQRSILQRFGAKVEQEEEQQKGLIDKAKDKLS